MESILRVPSTMRLMMTIKLTAWAMRRFASSAVYVAMPVMIMVSKRENVVAMSLAWTVVSDPSCPVVMALIISMASAPRHSPTIILSGRIRRALITSWWMDTSPRPSMLGGRLSKRTRLLCLSWSSAASSIVTRRS